MERELEAKRRITLRWLFQKWAGDRDRIGVGQNSGRWRAAVDVVMKFRIP